MSDPYACAIVDYPDQTCVVCPEVPAIAAVAERTITDPLYGWNASAYSATRREGDCYVQFGLPSAIGTVVGLANARLSHDPRDVPHAFYAYRADGREYWVVSEGGVAVTAPVVRAIDTDVFRIERRDATIRYFHNGRQVHEAPALLGGLVVVACLYAAGDGVE